MTFTFTEQETQYIIQVLAQRPYAEVAKLLENIQKQIDGAKSE
jgi:hypothetical protein